MLDFLDNIGGIFNHKPGQAIGLDIGTRNIKIIDLKRKEKNNKTRYILENYALSSLQDADNSIKSLDIKQVAKIIQQTLESAKIIPGHVIISVSAFSTFLTLIKIPKVPSEGMQELISVEAKKYVSVPLETVTLGWYIISQEEKTMNALLIAVPKELTQRVAQIAQAAELDLKGIEVETFALARSLSFAKPDLVMIIDIGAQGINIAIVQKGIVFMQRTVNLSHDKIKNKPTLVLNEVRSINQIFNQKYNKKANKIILTGGGANLPQLIQLFNQDLGTETIKGNPWKNIFYKNKKLYPYLRDLDASFSVAIGLALKDLI